MAIAAIEQFFPKKERIVDDKLAYSMMPMGGKVFVNLMKMGWMKNWIISLSEKSQPGIWGGLLCRKRYIDEKLMESSGDMQAFVNLGAGFDTRPYRVPAISNLPVWEIDQPGSIEVKKKLIRRIFGKIPDNVNLVGIDFDHSEIATVLASYQYSQDKRGFFVCEAVTQYLTDDGIKRLFEFLAGASAGSRLVFSYVRKDFFEGRNLYKWMSGYKRLVLSKIWLTALEPEDIPDFLLGYGWRILEHLGYDEMAKDFIGRTDRNLKSTPIERMVYAEKN
jgi:methyltransferase (TIGR00027 family)